MDLKTAHRAIAEDNAPADEVYAAVVREGRRRRTGRVLLRIAAASVVVAAGALAIAAAGGDDRMAATDPGRTRAPEVAETTTVSTTTMGSTVPGGLGPSGHVSLRAPDWQASVDADQQSSAFGTAYVVRDASGTVESRGTMGTFGEAVIVLPLGAFTIEVDALRDGTPCGFVATVTIEADRQEVPLGLRCG
jgi:hypothetical protein